MKVHFKFPIFLIAILGGSLVGGLVLGGSFLKERWEPRITQIDILSVNPGKTEFTFNGSEYPNERCEYHYLVYTSWSAYRFRVVVESFSEELQVLDGSKTVGSVPYILQQGNLPEERCIWLGFTVVMPNQTGTYEVDLSITLYGWLFSREYKWMYTFTVEPSFSKPPPEERLTITLDKETYHQGEIMNLTIENISNETVWFTNTAYDLFFERFNGKDWEFHTPIVGGAAMTPLEPSETAQFTWKLSSDFSLGHYRVGTHGVYAEFEVI